MEKKLVYFTITLLIISLMAVSVVSAGFFDWFKPTGKAAAQLTNVTVGVTGINPAQIIYVSPISAVNPLEAGSKAVTFSVRMKDIDGVNDLNDTSVSANFSKTDEATRFSSACTWVNDIDTTTANYSCSIDMWYWDGASTSWGVGVKGKDLGNLTEVYNTTTIFGYNELKAMVISPPALTWAALNSGDANKESTNDPTVVNNTGNYNSTIALTAINLLGAITPADMIAAADFKTDVSSPCSGITLVNASAATITNSVANRGNLSAGSGAGQEELYYCIPLVPNVPSQTYSTAAGGSWTVAY